MARNRRTYRNQQSPPSFPGAEPDPYAPPPPPEAGPYATPPPPAAAPQGSGWLKTVLTIAGGAVVGVIAADFYRKNFSARRNQSDDDSPAPTTHAMMTGAPQIIPMPMPMPMPMFGGYAPNPPPPQYPSRPPMSEKAQIELAKLELARAEAEASIRAWEDED